MAKRLDLLTQAVPRISRIIFLYDSGSVDQAEAAKRSAATLGIPLEPIKLRGVPYDCEHALAERDGARGKALMVTSSPFGPGRRTCLRRGRVVAPSALGLAIQFRRRGGLSDIVWPG
jgi:hypothetical protein